MVRKKVLNTKAVTITIPKSVLDGLRKYAILRTGGNLSKASSDLLERLLARDIKEISFSAAIIELSSLVQILEKTLSEKGVSCDELSAIEPLYKLKPKIDALYQKVEEFYGAVKGIQKYVLLRGSSFLEPKDKKYRKV